MLKILMTTACAVTLMLVAARLAAADNMAETDHIDILFLEQRLPPRPVLSNIRPTPADTGLAGARLGISDNNTTGQFLGYQYRLTHIAATDAAELLRRASEWLRTGGRFIITKLPTDTLLTLTEHPDVANQAIVFNAGNSDDRLRTQYCREKLLHTLPSRAMLADGLAQFLVSKRWTDWLLLRGQQAEDALYTAALHRAAKRFGGRIIDERQWYAEASDLRRSAQQEMPLFTQAKDYHVVLVADEIGDIGEYLPYNTWLPRPVAGTQGLTPTAWHWSIEQWGGAQLQNRFRDLNHREMNAEDYAAWLAARAVGEAVLRTRSSAVDAVYPYLRSEHFQLSAFKGRPLSFRPWNGQMRQPIPLVQPNAVVSQSPQEGFLHPFSTMDTLGFDRTEVQCTMRHERP